MELTVLLRRFGKLTTLKYSKEHTSIRSIIEKGELSIQHHPQSCHFCPRMVHLHGSDCDHDIYEYKKCTFGTDTIRAEDAYAYHIDGYRTIVTCGLCMTRVNGLDKIVDNDFKNHLRMIISVSEDTKLCYYDTIDWDLVSNDLTEHTSDENITVTFWVDDNYRTDIPSIENMGMDTIFQPTIPTKLKNMLLN
jgi:hypothetical protein